MRSAAPDLQRRRTRRGPRADSAPREDRGGASAANRLARLWTAVDDALAGRGRLVLVECEAHRMERVLDEVQDYAEGRAARVLRARCVPPAGDMAPWEEIAATLGAPEAGGRQARFERFEEIAGLLEERACEKPLVVLITALHHAGRSGLLLLEWLARFLPDCPLAIIGTYEDLAETPDHPLAETLAELAHEPACERLALTGASERTPPAGSVQAVFRLAGDYWTIAFESRVIRLRDTKGLRYLAPLLHRPGERVHVLELQAAATGRRPPARPDIEDKTRAERARLAVTKGLKAALERIAAAHPPLGQHLGRTVRRGYFCAYVPDPRRPIVWRG